MKKILMIIGGLVVGSVILTILIFMVISSTTKKMICKSNEGNITLRYNDKTLVGYISQGIDYDLDGQKKYANQIGIENYLNEFAVWFSNNTTGTCAKQS